jgi:hypothetical protein
MDLFIMKNNYAFVLRILTAGLIATGLLHLASLNKVSAASGAIWTTSGSCGAPQNINHYPSNASVFINGSGFDTSTSYSWDVSDPGLGGTTFNSGTIVSDGNGAFCFNAGTFPSGGPYQAKVGEVKGDNFSIDPDVSPTITPTPFETPTPTEIITPTPTPCVDQGGEFPVVCEPTLTPTETPAPTSPPSNGGGTGDGRSDGKSDGGSSCPACTAPPSGNVLGASTGGQVLGASTDTLAATGSQNFMTRMLTSVAIGMATLFVSLALAPHKE